MWWIVAVGLLILAIVIAVRNAAAEQQKLSKLSPGERLRYLAEQNEKKATEELGPINPAMVCPHCQTKGRIRTKAVVQKKGISGGKATAALFTGGASMLVTGLSRKEQSTKATCGHCKNTWLF